MFDWLFDLLNNVISSSLTGFVFSIVWLVLIGPILMLLETFEQLFVYLSGQLVLQVIFGIGSTDAAGNTITTFSFANLPIAFWAFLIFSFMLMGVLWGVNYWSICMSDDLEVKERLVKATKFSLIGIATAVFMPLALFILAGFTVHLVNLIVFIFGNNEGGANKASSISGMLYHIGDVNWDGKITVAGGTALWKPPGNLLEKGQYNILVTIAGTFGMFYGMAIGVVSLALKTFEIFWLFIKGPVVAATTVQDDGARLKVWREAILNKFLAVALGLSTYLSSIVLLGILIKIKPSQVIPGAGGMTDTTFRLIMILASAAWIMMGPSLASMFTGGEKAIDRAANESVKGAVKAAGVGVLASARVGGVGAGIAIGSKTLQNKSWGLGRSEDWKKKHGLGGLNNRMMGGSDQLSPQESDGVEGMADAAEKMTQNTPEPVKNMFGAWRGRGGAVMAGVGIAGAVLGTGAALLSKKKRGAAKAKIGERYTQMRSKISQKVADVRTGEVGGKGTAKFEGDYETRFNNATQRLTEQFNEYGHFEEGTKEYAKAHKGFINQRAKDIKMVRKAGAKEKAIQHTDKPIAYKTTKIEKTLNNKQALAEKKVNDSNRKVEKINARVEKQNVKPLTAEEKSAHKIAKKQTSATVKHQNKIETKAMKDFKPSKEARKADKTIGRKKQLEWNEGMNKTK
ncbi:hypothetical protein ELUMI_v1c05110 [Williamsoniiplasma luminosum]|uniref:Uncharacterized protein n=1 Tax=Williamsoniiplasma luminosum TaxID=214888 RepID=A0A2K8NTQ7_9MOLU|nr:hypothetical protein [Williamsoniiplasma luminosum]ATZ17235.1 hypothetical protein ELUMI_v1c05110 [Williamsoniiplasma luminosum]